MNQFSKTMKRLSLILMLVLPGYAGSVYAESSSFQTFGEILMINQKNINVGDHLFPMISTVKVSIPGKSKAGLKDLKKGNYVRVLVQKYNGKFYVDTIYYLSNRAPN